MAVFIVWSSRLFLFTYWWGSQRLPQSFPCRRVVGTHTGTVITAAGRSSIWWMTTTRACHFYGANLMEVWNSSKLYWLSERTARTWLKFELTQRKNISDEKQQRIMPAKHQAPQLQLFLFIFQKIFLPKDIFLKLTKDIFLNLIKDIFSESTTGSPLLVIIRW